MTTITIMNTMIMTMNITIMITIIITSMTMITMKKNMIIITMPPWRILKR